MNIVLHSDYDITLQPIGPAQAPILRNLFELYAHDFSEFVPFEIRPDGRFGSDCDKWWSEPEREAWFIHAAGKLAGFALIGRGSRVRPDANVRDVGEFFVLRYLRRRGVGIRAARAVFERHPGAWEVRVRAANQGALEFWTAAARDVTSDRYRVMDWRSHDADWRVLSFDTSRE